jgi:hypothetical protein
MSWPLGVGGSDDWQAWGARRVPSVAWEPPPGFDPEEVRRYADLVAVVVRREDWSDPGAAHEALVASIDVGGDVPLEELAHDLGQELVRLGAGEYSFETRRTRTEIGASGAGALLVVTIIASGVAGVLLQEVWEYTKQRLGRGRPVRDYARYIRSAPEYAARELASAVAQAIDARLAEIRTVEVVHDAEQIRGIFETSTGERYRVTLADEVFEIARLPQPAAGAADGEGAEGGEEA